MTDPSSTPVNLAKLSVDLRRYSEIAGVACDSVGVDRVLDTLADLSVNASVGVRTTTKPVSVRDVNFRLLYPDPVHPVARLCRAGLLTFDGHPMENLLDEVVDRFPLRWGVDASVRGVVDKIWVMFDGGVALEEILALPHLPHSVREARAHFDKSGLDCVGLLAFDFTSHTVNVYRKPFTSGTLTPGSVAEIISDLGFPLPSHQELEHDGRAFSIYYTFSWDTPGVQRVCFPMLYAGHEFPTYFDPLLKDFVEQAPVAAASRSFGFYTTYGPNGGYFKVQADYVHNRARTACRTRGTFS
jgi:aromatic prenyltransferase